MTTLTILLTDLVGFVVVGLLFYAKGYYDGRYGRAK